MELGLNIDERVSAQTKQMSKSIIMMEKPISCVQFLRMFSLHILL